MYLGGIDLIPENQEEVDALRLIFKSKLLSSYDDGYCSWEYESEIKRTGEFYTCPLGKYLSLGR